MNTRKFEIDGKQYDYKGLQELALKDYDNPLSIVTIQKRVAREWDIKKVISTPYKVTRGGSIKVKNSILNMFLLEHNLTQQMVARNNDITAVTLAKLVPETVFSGKFGIKTLKTLSNSAHISIAEVTEELIYAGKVLAHEEVDILDLASQLEKYLNLLPFIRYINTRVIGNNDEIDILFKTKTLYTTRTKEVAITKKTDLSYWLTIDGKQLSFIPYHSNDHLTDLNLNLQKTFLQLLNKDLFDRQYQSFPKLTPLNIIMATHGYTLSSFAKKFNYNLSYFTNAQNTMDFQSSFSTNMFITLADHFNITVPDLIREFKYASELCSNKDSYALERHLLSIINQSPFLDITKKVFLEKKDNTITLKIRYASFKGIRQTQLDITPINSQGGSQLLLENGVNSYRFVPVDYNTEAYIFNSLIFDK